MVCINEPDPKRVVSAAIIYDKRILVVKKKHTWILPGGKPEEKESDIECLLREINEELPGTRIKIESIRKYRDFEGRTPYSNKKLLNRVYFAEMEKIKTGESFPLGKPGSEISDLAWIKNLGMYNLSDVTSKVIDSLIDDNYVRYEHLRV